MSTTRDEVSKERARIVRALTALQDKQAELQGQLEKLRNTCQHDGPKYFHADRNWTECLVCGGNAEIKKLEEKKA